MIENILRLPRTDSEREFVLVNVSSNGPSPLDLKLLATEGENPFMTTGGRRLLSSMALTDY